MFKFHLFQQIFPDSALVQSSNFLIVLIEAAVLTVIISFKLNTRNTSIIHLDEFSINTFKSVQTTRALKHIVSEAPDTFFRQPENDQDVLRTSKWKTVQLFREFN
jgi:hypothetical protein